MFVRIKAYVPPEDEDEFIIELINPEIIDFSSKECILSLCTPFKVLVILSEGSGISIDRILNHVVSTLDIA